MYPILFKVGPFPVYSFGLLMGAGFIIGSYFLSNELKRLHIDQAIGSTVTMFAIVFGIIGSKLLFVIENWNDFTEHPTMVFSPGGLTWYGGFILATIAIILYVRKKGIPFLKVCDSASPALALGYGIARIGCHLSGDGDYGIPTTLPWGQIYSNGTYKPHDAVTDYFARNPESARLFDFHNLKSQIVERVTDDHGKFINYISAFDTTVRFHPAPLYELLLGIVVFLVLWSLRKKILVDGKLFMVYLMLSGIARFCVEFIRLNPRLFFGLSEAQLIAAVIVVIGLVGFGLLSKHREEIVPTQ
jgi:phosphatidylglycerol:prolipoprotein diacylglycerol transferase